MINGLATLQVENDRLMISGDLNFVTAMSLWNESLPLLQAKNIAAVDFSRVTSSNSAGLALIVEWIKWAKAERAKISFHAIPANIAAIAKVAGLEKIIF